MFFDAGHGTLGHGTKQIVSRLVVSRPKTKFAHLLKTKTLPI